MSQHEIIIPFSGFYNSVHDEQIDHCIEQAFDHDGTGSPEIPDDFYIKMDYSYIWPEYAALYCAWTEYKINEYLDLNADPLKITFKDLVSPKYYNYSTDRLFAEISDKDILRLYSLADKDILEKLVFDTFTSRDGFSSYYQNSLKEVPNQDYKISWDKPVIEWDCNQLGTLLIAAILTKLKQNKHWISEEKYFEEYQNFNEFLFIEDISGSGKLDQIVWNNAPKECLDMVNSYYEKQSKKED